MTYAEKLRDPRWQKKRLRIMERDDFTCQICKSTTKTLNVHHKFYEGYKDPWDYEDEILVTLCEDCHRNEEQGPSVMKQIMHDLLRRGFTYMDLNQYLLGLIIENKEITPTERAQYAAFAASSPSILSIAKEDLKVNWDEYSRKIRLYLNV